MAWEYDDHYDYEINARFGEPQIYNLETGWFQDPLRDYTDRFFYFSPDGYTSEAAGHNGFTAASNLPQLFNSDGWTYDSLWRPDETGDNVTLTLDENNSVFTGLPSHPYTGKEALTQTLDREFEGAYWEGTWYDDQFTLDVQSSATNLRSFYYVGESGNDTLTIRGDFSVLDGNHEGADNSPSEVGQEFSGGSGYDTLIIDANYEDNFTVNFSEQERDYVAYDLGRVQPRFEIEGPGSSYFLATDVDKVVFNDKTFTAYGRPYLGPTSGPRAKNFDSGLVIQEGDIQSGLNFGYIYSELVKVKDYEPSGDYPGYVFTADDFQALEVDYYFGSESSFSLEDGGITVDDAGNITIDTNAPIYKELYQGEREEVYVVFNVTDDYYRTDEGEVTFEVIGAGPQAKNFNSGLVIEEDTIQSGLNFGFIYSELVKTKAYEATDDNPGYTFTAQNFEALEVILGSDDPVSLHEGGITVDEDGNITIDTNAPVYQKLNNGDREQATVLFKVTDNNDHSDIGSVFFDVTGKDDPTGPASLGLSYELYNSEGIALTQLSVLGDDVKEASEFVLNLKAESLEAGHNLESTDLTIRFNPNLFNTIETSDITIGGSLPIANAVQIDNTLGTIRIAAASLSDLGQGNSITDPSVLASISLDFDEKQIKTLQKNEDGSLKINPLAFEITANSEETIFSTNFDDGTEFENRKISSLADLGGSVDVDGKDVTLYEAKINLAQQGDGLVLASKRVIGADATTTNLIRSGDTLTTSAEWLNIGNIKAHNLSYEGLDNQNASLINASFSKSSINSGSFIDGVFVKDARESTTLTTEIKVTGEAGNVVDLADGIVSVKADAEGSETFTNKGKGSSNLITFQGDLNYDGRVSMKDLAYLNAGAARQQLVESTDESGSSVQVASEASYARDVDADFNGRIDLADLSVLDADWGKTLHTGDEQFQGSADVSWSELDTYGAMTWDNTSFKDQNAIEADAGYVGSLETAVASVGIGADSGNTPDPVAGAADQHDPLIAK